jgi:hypothetical protein
MIVCSGVLMGWYGADVTPWIFYENFIELMVTIDAVNGGAGLLRAVCQSTRLLAMPTPSRASPLPQVFAVATGGRGVSGI